MTPSPDSKPILSVEGVTKSYRLGRVAVNVLKGVDMTVAPGELLAVVGASGSGKSTLLHLMGALDRPDGGVVRFEGRDLDRMGGRRRNRLRNAAFGFVFQFYHLLPELTVLENTLLPTMVQLSTLSWLTAGRRRRRQAIDLLERLGLGERLKHRPVELSGGERQRVAIARALVNQPQVLFADEPTGNLDAATGESILKVLRRLHRERGQTMVLVTHDPRVAAYAHRTVELHNGRVREFKTGHVSKGDPSACSAD